MERSGRVIVNNDEPSQKKPLIYLVSARDSWPVKKATPILTKQITIDIGTGDPTLVFIHGLCCAPADYQNILNGLSQTHRVLAPTLRGHSEDGSIVDQMSIERLAADIAKLIVDRKINKAILCGHSLGTRVAIEAQALLPERIAGLILIDGSNVATDTQELLLDNYNTATSGNKFEPWLQHLFSQMFLPRQFEKEQMMYRERITRLPHAHLATLYRNLIIWDSEKFTNQLLAATNKPILVVQSTVRASATTRRSLATGETGDYPQWVRTTHNNTTVIAYPHTSHFVHLDEPEKLLNDVLQWISDQGHIQT